MKRFLLALSLGVLAFSQTRKITDAKDLRQLLKSEKQDESERARIAQDPNERLKLYTLFARQRVDKLGQLFSKEKAGRSVFIYELLDQYAQIIEAMDVVVDDAFRRDLLILEGLQAAMGSERAMLKKLEAFAELKTKDLSHYELALTTTIETTRDSITSNEELLADRTKRVVHQSKQEKVERERLMTVAEKEEMAAAEKKLEGQNPPTLRKKGDIPAKL